MSERKTLTLEDKISLIKDNQNGGKSTRDLAIDYGISKSSAANIIRRKQEYLSDYASNCNKGIKRKHKDDDGQKIEELVFEWFTIQRSKNIPISGPILQEKVRQFAEQLGYLSDEFKASHGWLEKFRARHAISFRLISGESASVDHSTVEEWTKRLLTIIEGFDKNDIFNADETGLFYRTLPDRSLVLQKEECKGGKKKKLEPLVIGRSQRRRCLKNINISDLPVTWLANRTAWMNLKLFTNWLATLNNRMKRNACKIILFLDNAPGHIVDETFSNVKLVFFPPNTTSKCQPLDQGVIKSFKCYYRQKLVRHIISQCTTALTIDQVSISVLEAIKWIDLAWKAVTNVTIQGGFRAAGFIDSSLTSLSTIDIDIADQTSLQLVNHGGSLEHLEVLLAHVRIDGQQLTAAEFVDIDSSIPAFNEWEDDVHLKDLIEISQGDENEEEETSVTKKLPNIAEILEMVKTIHLYAIHEQPQLHNAL
ncbi:unnamed protein product [Adineta ricciae]|uniref:HTH CENPB-type domain-containing protein n=1 Tax=Adineta ricciae TaxID=249248 RepID=A0A816BNI6_ADIRI|nr:unnamed protein product [Adineta ricciae]